MEEIIPMNEERRKFLKNASLITMSALMAKACGSLEELEEIPPLVMTDNGRAMIQFNNFPALRMTEGFAYMRISGIDDPLVAFRLSDSNIHVISRVCTHRQCTVKYVRLETAGELQCPCHFSRFDLSGAVLEGPASRPLPTYTVEYNPGDDFFNVVV